MLEEETLPCFGIRSARSCNGSRSYNRLHLSLLRGSESTFVTPFWLL